MTKTSIKDIAYHAGVSIATVSNSLRNPHRVADATRERVLSTIKELGYVPNKFGVGLRTSKSNTILAIIPDTSNSFYAGIIEGMESVLSKRGYSVLLTITRGREEREKEHALFASTGQADGILLFSHRYPYETDEQGRALPDNLPVVSCCEDSKVSGVPVVSIDNVQAAVDATRLLLNYGHRNIGVLTGNMEFPSNQDRLLGFRQAMGEAGIPVNEANIFSGEYCPDFCLRAIKELMGRKEKPSVLFCFGDEMAHACLVILTNEGISVPDECAVMGFDGIQFLKSLPSPLSSIAQPFYEIGCVATEMLLDMIDGRPVAEEKVYLKHKIYPGLTMEVENDRSQWFYLNRNNNSAAYR